MVMTRWWRLLSLVVLMTCGWGCGTAQAQAQHHRNAGPDCHVQGLKGSTVKAALRLLQHKRAHPLVTSDMTVWVPRHWQLAEYLTFSEDSEQYRTAMRCLLRGNEAPAARTEWHADPDVMATTTQVKVHYVAYDWITSEKPRKVGPWQIAPAGNKWNIILRPPALQKNLWSEITADLGGLNFNDFSGHAWSSTEKSVTWRNQPPDRIQVQVDLSWQRSLAVFLSKPSLATAGVAAWWVSASVLLALAALRVRRPRAAPADGTAGHSPPGGQPSNAEGAEGSLPRTLLQWALLSGAVALTLLLLVKRFSPRSQALLCIPAGLALLLVARPWNHGGTPIAPGAAPQEPARPEDVQPRKARTVVSTGCAVAGVGLLVIVAHELFGLPENLQPTTATVVGRAGLVLLGLSITWLWLAAMAAWAWRFASEGNLLSKRWAARWDRTPAHCVAVAGGLLVTVAAALLVCAWWGNRQRWMRVNWLVARPDSAAYDKDLNTVLTRLFFTDLNWLFAYSWVLTGIALLALLTSRNRPRRARGRRRPARHSLGPDKPDLLLIVAMFALFVGLRAAAFAGASAVYGVWLPLNILSVYAVLALGRRSSVLSELGDRFCVQRLGTEKHRREMMSRAHQYSNVNHQMYLLDQGRAGATTREQLQEQLRQLRQWLTTACDRGNPPDQISVLDVALAWGPDGHWWYNATRAARLAFWFGTPATALLVYFQMQEPYFQGHIKADPTGIPDFLASLALYQMAWTAAGFTLGALWRLLPGRRSQARAWMLAAAYGIPVLAAAGLVRLTDTDTGQMTLYTLLLLGVLTLTSIWMDMATFREERQYTPSPFALLVSIYQLRGLSVRIAWLLTQLTAVVALYQKLKP
ncbi:DUF6185 family protein [Streptomyces capoamus]|uniref:DUF6185 family protein n=1 Tax=Streptomyces capoamus TaxID=68183 RepID=UPI0033916FFF